MNALWDLAASACIVAAVVIIHDALEIWTDSAVYDLDGSLIPARLTDRELDATQENRMTTLPPGDHRHGTVNGYTNLKCRCQSCRDAWAADNKARRSAREGRLATADVAHGNASTYSNHRCRCGPCRDAHAAYMRKRRAA